MHGNALLILHEHHEKVGTIRDHVRAILDCEHVNVVKVDFAIAEHVEFAHFNVVLLHYSIVIASRSYVSSRLRDKLAAFRGLKVLFIQDEYRWIDKTSEAIRDLGVHVVFSLCNPQIVRKVYHHLWFKNVRFEYTLTGFVSEDLCRLRVPDYELCPLDVAYRARKLNSWMGYRTIQKWQIAERFLDDAGKYGLAVDISTREEDRLYGDAWINLLTTAKAVLGTESAASVFDFTGEIQKKSEAYMARHADTGFEELRRRFFPDVDGKIVINVISPRCFEAAALRSLMVMYKGEYSGILEAGRHYIELEQDHSNMEEVVRTIRSPDKARRIIKSAYEEIAMSGRWTHRSFTDHVSRVLLEEMAHHAVPVASHSHPAATIVTARAAVAAATARAATAAQIAARARRLSLQVATAGVYTIDNWVPKRMRQLVRPHARTGYYLLRSLGARCLPLISRVRRQ